MVSVSSLQDIPGLQCKFPSSPLAQAAALFAKDHCDNSVYYHAIRCAYWALIIAKKNPKSASQSLDIDLVVIICLLHDMGLASSAPDALPGLSPDKRFEVDSANIAKAFVASRTGAAEQRQWDAAKLDRLWMAIALHTTPSIALHAGPEAALASKAITADFAGPYWSSDGQDRPITVEEYRVVTKAFPRGNFDRKGLKEIMCGLCLTKPATTYDNFVGIFGRNFGYDGKGLGQETFAREWEENQVVGSLLRGLDVLNQLDVSPLEQLDV